MSSNRQKHISRLRDLSSESVFENRKIGLEKECLRVSPEGSISQTPHPYTLGSALTNPSITTDYSESLLEFITPPLDHISNALSYLADIQKFVYSKLDNEILWATSMPCVIPGETSIPLAQYGHSNAGTMKTVYRRGLGLRYGNVMQVIAGVHFNYSYPDKFWLVYNQIEQSTKTGQEFVADSYFAILRNLQRYGWLIPLLFGASPAVCKSFLGGQATNLKSFNENTYYEPYATSLRMGDIGYTNKKEGETGVSVCYDDLQKYTASLGKAIETDSPEYRKFGLIKDNVYQQLNTNILQIENEYYSTVRPKQILDRFEKPIHALKRRGVKYIELRSLDVNAYDPLGINENQLRWLEVFMLFCLLQNSRYISTDERLEIDNNLMLVAHQGRKPGLQLSRKGRQVKLSEWASEIMENMQGVAEILDSNHATKKYSDVLSIYSEMVTHPDMTPSAIMLQDMSDNQEGFFHFASRMSHKHQQYFASLPEDKKLFDRLEKLSVSSHAEQRKIEEADTLSFAEYLDNYFNQQL